MNRPWTPPEAWYPQPRAAGYPLSQPHSSSAPGAADDEVEA